MTTATTCVMCRGVEGDPEIGRVQVWENDHWRLTTSIHPTETVRGFSFLEPKRHIPDITTLDRHEAVTFGEVIGKVTAALKEVTGPELVYVYVFGGHVDHLHIHLAPHTDGDSLLRGEFIEEPLPSGAVAVTSRDFPPVPEGELRATAERVRDRLVAG